eukprot:GHVP01035607.1.p1 GENE.GHVP01035607.1~~GHVP01035607.1.p1  ORF type:complete len:1055 (-),score=284.46 GHVP01035607.1:141-3305(-)
MTTLLKLGIRGIRSFGPNHLETISFETPLTLIVGQNGAGKTTIVESLKMSCTGELPPNSNKGHSFVHDPKILGVPEVKGQIRLKFQTLDDKEISTTRSFQLTNSKDSKGKSKVQFKALETALKVLTTDGQESNISQRCADMDNQIPMLMGISKPILEHVVFCHQEDSTWPLSDMAKLKKKFDDLFGATRYTVALNQITDARKTLMKEQKEYSHEVTLCSSFLEQAQHLRGKLTKTENLIQEQNEALQVFNSEYESAQEAMKEAQRDFESVASAEAQISQYQKFIEGLQGEVNTLTEKVTEIYEDSDLELQQCRSELISGLKKLESSVFEEEKRTPLLQEELDNLTNEREKLRKFSADLYRYKERLENLVKQRDAIFEQNKIFGEFSTDIETVIQKFMENEKRNLASLNEDLTETTKLLNLSAEKVADYQRQLSSLANKLSNSLAAENSLRTSVSEGKEEITHELEVAKELSNVRNAINKISGFENERETETELEVLTAKSGELEENRTKFLQLVKKFDESESLLHSARAKEFEVETLKQSLDKLQETRSEKKKELTNVLSKIKMKNNRPTLEDIQTLSFECKAKKESLLSANSLHDGEVGSLKAQQSSLESAVEEGTRELQALTENLKRLGVEEIAEFPTLVEKYDKDVIEITKDTLAAEHAERMFCNFLKYAKQKKKCGFCARDFSATSEIEVMEAHLKNRMENLPLQINEYKEKLESAKTQFENLKSATGDYHKGKNLKDRLPLDETNLKLISKKFEEINDKKFQVQSEIKECKAQEDILNKAMEILSSQNQIEVEIEDKNKILKQVSTEVDTIRSQADSSLRNISFDSLRQQRLEAQEKADALANEKYETEYEISKVKNKKADFLSKKIDLETKKIQLEQKINHIERTKTRITNEINKLNSVEQEITQFTNEKELIDSSLKTSQQNFNSASEKKMKLTFEINTKNNETEKVISNLKQISQKIVETTNILSESSTLEGKIDLVSNQIDKKTSSVVENRDLLTKYRDEAAKQIEWMKDLDGNLELRKKEEELKSIKNDMAKLVKNTSKWYLEV